MRRLCTICARGGSKGVPGKNLRPIAGRPLVAISIGQALASRLFDCVAVSSDDPRILQVGKEAGAGEVVLRPPELATDRAGKLPAIRHCLIEVENRRSLEYETLVDLDVTSPLRTVDDIQAAVTLLESSEASNVITAAPARRSPYFNLVETGSDGSVRLSKPMDPPIRRRQDAPACFDMNASIYAWRRDRFLARPDIFYEDTRLYVMPEERSIDIDSELDLEIVEMLLSRRTRHSA